MSDHLEPARAASDSRINAVLDAPTIERRREAAAALRESDWQRLAEITFSAEQLAAAAEAD